MLAEAGVETYLLMQRVPQNFHQLPDEYVSAKGLEAMVMPVTKIHIPGRAFLGGLTYSAFMQSNHIQSYSIYSRWFHRNEKFGQRVQSKAIKSIGGLIKSPRYYNALSSLNETIYKFNTDIKPFREHLIHISPDLLWSTALVTNHEHGYVTAAKELKILYWHLF